MFITFDVKLRLFFKHNENTQEIAKNISMADFKIVRINFVYRF